MHRRIALCAALLALLALPAFAAESYFFNNAVGGTVVNVSSAKVRPLWMRLVNTTGLSLAGTTTPAGTDSAAISVLLQYE